MKKRTRRPRRGIAIGLEIGGEVWRRVASLDASGPDDRHFVVTTEEDGAATVRFGDGEHGAPLPTGTGRVVAAYRPARRFAAVLQQRGRVLVDQDWSESGPTSGRFCGVYRGVVTNTLDPMSRSRVQVQVPDVLGSQALWAAACQPVGASAAPAPGASVWVAFEGGDLSRPVWIGVVP